MPLKKLAVAGNIDAGSLRAVLPEGEWELVHVRSCMEALSAQREHMPGVFIADAVLPGGDGYSLAGLLRRADAPVRPGVVIACLPGMERSADMPGVTAVRKPIEPDKLRAAIESVCLENRRPTAAMESCIEKWLDELGVPEHPGRRYLADAVFLSGEDMNLINALVGKLYPLTAARSGVNPEAVERAMRHAIEAAWARGSIESQYGIFKNTIDAARGKPTCGGMIAQLAHMLRREVF